MLEQKLFFSFSAGAFIFLQPLPKDALEPVEICTLKYKIYLT